MSIIRTPLIFWHSAGLPDCEKVFGSDVTEAFSSQTVNFFLSERLLLRGVWLVFPKPVIRESEIGSDLAFEIWVVHLQHSNDGEYSNGTAETVLGLQGSSNSGLRESGWSSYPASLHIHRWHRQLLAISSSLHRPVTRNAPSPSSLDRNIKVTVDRAQMLMAGQHRATCKSIHKEERVGMNSDLASKELSAKFTSSTKSIWLIDSGSTVSRLHEHWRRCLRR